MDKKKYFAEKEEQAVLSYIASTSFEEKNEIYNSILIEPFRKMIQSILRRYPIHIGNYEMEEVEQNALTHLIEHMVKYKPFIIERKNDNPSIEKWTKLGEGFRFIYLDDANDKLAAQSENYDGYKYRLFHSKAFSYCQTIVRNYFKDHSKRSYTEKKINLSFDDYVDEINQNIEYNYEMGYEEEHYRLEHLINNVLEKIEEKIADETTIKKNEAIVGEAIINVLKFWHVLFQEDTPAGKYNKRVTKKFEKNKILFFLKEQTNLSTKEIRMAIKPFKEIYYIEKSGFLED